MSNRNYLITGATQGVGREIAALLARECAGGLVILGRSVNGGVKAYQRGGAKVGQYVSRTLDRAAPI